MSISQLPRSFPGLANAPADSAQYLKNTFILFFWPVNVNNKVTIREIQKAQWKSEKSPIKFRLLVPFTSLEGFSEIWVGPSWIEFLQQRPASEESGTGPMGGAPQKFGSLGPSELEAESPGRPRAHPRVHKGQSHPAGMRPGPEALAGSSACVMRSLVSPWPTHQPCCTSLQLGVLAANRAIIIILFWNSKVSWGLTASDAQQERTGPGRRGH